MSGSATLGRGATAEMVSGALARLNGALDELLAADLDGLGDEVLAGHLRALERVSARLSGASLRVLRRFDERVVWASTSAANSAAAWLAHETGTVKADAASRVRLARTTFDMPAASEALAAGEVTPAHVRVLARAVGPRTIEAFRRDEAMLVGHARQLTADQLAKVVRYWLEHVDQDGPAPADDPSRDTVSLSRSYNGRWLLQGDLCNESGAALHAALQEKVDELTRADLAVRQVDPTDPRAARSAGNRRAEALLELVERGASAPDTTARRRPAFDVLVDAATAAQAAGTIGNASPGTPPRGLPDVAVHELLDGTVLSLDTVALWLCDCELGRVVLGPDGEPLDVGRTSRTATPAQRRALAARDRGCAVSGCDRPAAWCDAHHIEWWEHGGNTDIDNLVLLCRHHHRRIHHRTLRVRMSGHRPAFTLPDGTELVDPRRPTSGADPPSG